MTRKEALDFIKSSEAEGFRYGDLSYVTEKADAIADIENMEDLAWGDGEVYEEYDLYDDDVTLCDICNQDSYDCDTLGFCPRQ